MTNKLKKFVLIYFFEVTWIENKIQKLVYI